MSQQAALFPAKVWFRVGAILRRVGVASFLVLLAVTAILIAVDPHGLSYFDLSTISASGTTLALAGIGDQNDIDERDHCRRRQIETAADHNDGPGSAR
jgi:hypothetical protein